MSKTVFPLTADCVSLTNAGGPYVIYIYICIYIYGDPFSLASFLSFLFFLLCFVAFLSFFRLPRSVPARREESLKETSELARHIYEPPAKIVISSQLTSPPRDTGAVVAPKSRSCLWLVVVARPGVVVVVVRLGACPRVVLGPRSVLSFCLARWSGVVATPKPFPVRCTAR